jgi:hypothetical protein
VARDGTAAAELGTHRPNRSVEGILGDYARLERALELLETSEVCLRHGVLKVIGVVKDAPDPLRARRNGNLRHQLQCLCTANKSTVIKGHELTASGAAYPV